MCFCRRFPCFSLFFGTACVFPCFCTRFPCLLWVVPQPSKKLLAGLTKLWVCLLWLPCLARTGKFRKVILALTRSKVFFALICWVVVSFYVGTAIAYSTTDQNFLQAMTAQTILSVTALIVCYPTFESCNGKKRVKRLRRTEEEKRTRRTLTQEEQLGPALPVDAECSDGGAGKDREKWNDGGDFKHRKESGEKLFRFGKYSILNVDMSWVILLAAFTGNLDVVMGAYDVVSDMAEMRSVSERTLTWYVLMLWAKAAVFFCARFAFPGVPSARMICLFVYQLMQDLAGTLLFLRAEPFGADYFLLLLAIPTLELYRDTFMHVHFERFLRCCVSDAKLLKKKLGQNDRSDENKKNSGHKTSEFHRLAMFYYKLQNVYTELIAVTFWIFVVLTELLCCDSNSAEGLDAPVTYQASSGGNQNEESGSVTRWKLLAGLLVFGVFQVAEGRVAVWVNRASLCKEMQEATKHSAVVPSSASTSEQSNCNLDIQQQNSKIVTEALSERYEYSHFKQHRFLLYVSIVYVATHTMLYSRML